MRSVTGPATPLPMVMRSIERTGVTSAAVPTKNTSSARYSISRGMFASFTGMFKSAASLMMVSRVIPGRRRGKQCSFVDQENVHAGTFADVATGFKRDALGKAIEFRFHVNELGIHVIAGRFGHGRQRVGRHARPGADANIHAFRKTFSAEVSAPAPARHVHLDDG